MYRPPSSSSPRRFTPRRRIYPVNNSPSPSASRPQFCPNYRCDRPPGPPNFVVQLRSGARLLKRYDFEALIENLRHKPQRSHFLDHGAVRGTLFYSQWSEALETMVQLWEMRLHGVHSLTPWLIENIEASSDREELRDRLRDVFVEEVKGLMEGEAVQKWEKKLGFTVDEIGRVSKLLKRPQSLRFAEELRKQMEGLEKEKALIGKIVEEFRSGMRCILDHLEGLTTEENGFQVLRFRSEFDWDRIHCLILREIRRLGDGLPIYACRGEILRKIYGQQVTVLIGETGSGKSTQLVQFLADSGIAGDESVICTQPRKLAAISLTQRVKEECCGCYRDTSVICYPSYSSARQFDSKGVIFVTDNCLLQHYMNDKNLCGISCIIIDEAHERSLNTDILLASLRDLLEKRRPDLRLIIMSATVDTVKLQNYFFGCDIFHVHGRTFPVSIKYAPCTSGRTSNSGIVASYVSDVVTKVTEIHKTEKEGAILAFLTSQTEVEWACEKFKEFSAVVLPLHGKLSYEDQHRVFIDYPGKRKIIFTTNVAETSLTIPGVKYVVDSGMVKENGLEPATGMSILRVCSVSQSSANQRAGRAGRTGPGICYRLYSEDEFCSFPRYQEPEICRVHLGIVVLRILALGFANVQGFRFVDEPNDQSIEMACRNLIQLGAVTQRDDGLELTSEGWKLVKLGVEPRLGQIVLNCFDHRLGREGLVLAAVMANSSSIFCRVGSEEDKLKSDCIKVKFCHRNGDLFTLLSVYKEWEALPQDKKNSWCWDNSINAKSMRRCQDTVQELETCLQNELNIIVPSYWRWNPQMLSEHDQTLKHIILLALTENVAMYSGYDQLGYEVALTRKHVQLHPSCSLLVFGEKPNWVVFSEILASSNEYLVCVTAFDFKSLSTLSLPPPFDLSMMSGQKLQTKVLTGYGNLLLKRFCGKGNSSLHPIVSRIRLDCKDERIGVKVCVEKNEVILHASSKDMEQVCRVVIDALEYERKLLCNECSEKCLYSGGSSGSAPVALFGAGAEIKHLELEKRCLTVDVFHSNVEAVEDKELLMFLERSTSGIICIVHKFSATGYETGEDRKWGRVTFLTPDAAKRASALNQFETCGGLLRIVPCLNFSGSDQKLFRFPVLRAKVYWPRRYSTGLAIVKCEPKDVPLMVDDFSSVMIGGNYIRCEASMKSTDSIVVTGLNKELSEAEIFEVLRIATDRKILDFFLLRGHAVEKPSCSDCQEALVREILPLMPKRYHVNSVRVQVLQPAPKDHYMKATIIFDGDLHLEAAKALETIKGKVLPGCLPWQKIECQHLFHSSVSCPSPVYHVIKDQLDSLVAGLQRRKGVGCNLERNDNGSYRVKISAGGTKTVAEVRRPLQKLMNGKIIDHAGITPTVLQHLFSRDGIGLMRSIQFETGTYILFDRHDLTVRIFGSPDKVEAAEQKLVNSLLTVHENKQLEIQLHRAGFPPDLMKRVVENFGPDLAGLRERVPETELFLNTKRRSIYVSGTKEAKQNVQAIIHKIAQANSIMAAESESRDDEANCSICLCEVEEGFKLEGCMHEFCRSCLLEQCDSAIRTREGFPLRCAHKGCSYPILLTDLRSLLPSDKLEELFRAAVSAFVAGSGGTYRFCPSPDCPSVYRVTEPDTGVEGAAFVCGACCAETCTSCHVEYHPYLSCDRYRMFKDDPDMSLKDWCKGKENVKNCPVCRYTIEKVDGCNHIHCRCGKHVCWVCLEFYSSSDDCYNHLRS